jgi:hypothetical protein
LTPGAETSSQRWATHNDPERCAYLRTNSGLWQQFFEMEEQSCATPGALDGGTHILFAAAAR